MSIAAADSFRVLLGVMANPTSDRLRTQLREWNGRFAASRRGDVTVRYVFGSSFYNGTAPPGTAQAAHEEGARLGDLIFVDGRERLPHVGVVTEKSAAFWRSIAAREPGYEFYCKSDDDTLVHLDRLHGVLQHVARTEGIDRPVYMGHMKWRGWDTAYHFQACGGSWGGASKTKQDILFGGPVDLRNPDGAQYPPCPNAVGPYPYMSGGMVCMSAALARIMGADPAFGDFLTVAKARNDYGTRCRRPILCAAQPASVHMWHHEDAGIGFNVFRAIVSANATASIVPVPGHYNDPGIIERSPSPQDMYWSSRSLFTHGIKAAFHFETAKARWTLDRSSDHLTLSCDHRCSEHGAGGFGWDWARLECPRRRWDAPQTGRFCDVLPDRHYKCCNWPWVVPELRAAVLAALSKAPSQRLGVAALVRRTRREVEAAAVARPGCDLDCARVEVPNGPRMHLILEDMAARGEIGYSGASGEQLRPGEREVWLARSMR